MTELIERLEWLATYLRNEDLVYNDKAFGLRDELKKAADRLRKLEAVREAGIPIEKRFPIEIRGPLVLMVTHDKRVIEFRKALAACGDE